MSKHGSLNSKQKLPNLSVQITEKLHQLINIFNHKIHILVIKYTKRQKQKYLFPIFIPLSVSECKGAFDKNNISLELSGGHSDFSWLLSWLLRVLDTLHCCIPWVL